MGYKIRVKLLSDTIFGSGESVPGVVDAEVLHDQNGFPYMKGKTLKGRLREESDMLVRCLPESSELSSVLNAIYGSGEESFKSHMAFSNLELDWNLRAVIKGLIEDKNIDVDETDVLQAVTSIYTATSINYETSKAEKGTLRKSRVIKRGLIFYAGLSADWELTEKEEAFLGAGIAALKHLGVAVTRGRGNVECSLLKDGRDITEECVNKLLEEGA